MTRLLSQSFFRIQQVKLLRNIQRVKLKIADKRRWKFYVFLLVYAINKLNVNFKFKLATHGDPVARYHQPSNFSN
ncbi:hypothetical protein, partial [Enterococcus faecium]|uniref:hypothetical protein n=1 Tax=Enterococcus faecium TaxID=1352 RepID=UPI003AAEF156